MPVNTNSVWHVVVPPDFVRIWIGVVFLNAPAIHELFSIQGSMCAILFCSWPAVRAMPRSILLPTAPCLAQYTSNTLSSTAGEETVHGPKHGFLSSCLFLRCDHIPKKEPEINLILTN